MSDYHILSANDDARSALVAFHLPVPNVDNAVQVNLRLAVKQDPSASKTSKVPWIGQQEQSALTNGEIVEIVRGYSLKEGETPAEALLALDALFGTLTAKKDAELRNRYKFWGKDRDVP